MQNIIVGTAGHIDHGKTTLVKALTGIDADRLAEEKRRGITIDLGFAHLQLTPALRIGFVDVPGHERFIKNMLAGVGGIDVVLFVVAADESIKPQTREHFDICRLLGIQAGVIAVTKSDLVPQDLVDLVCLEMEELVGGSFLEGAEMIPVSATTGRGLNELKAALKRASEKVPVRDASGPARLPIDRAFSMRGFGTVVTGTLVSGSIEREAELELLPGGQMQRVRGLQVYGRETKRATAGTRTAVNLPDIEAPEVYRGMVLAEKDQFEPSQSVDCRLELLASARKLKNRAPVHFYAGTAEMEAHVRLFGRDALRAGESAFCRFYLEEPAILASGDRFIIRQFSPVTTIGGGWVVDAQPPRERRIARIQERLSVLAGEDNTAKAALLIEENPGGLAIGRLAARLSISFSEALALVKSAPAVVLEREGWAVSRKWVQEWRKQAIETVQAYHKANPLLPGVFKHELTSGLPRTAPPFLFDALLNCVPELVVEGDRVRHRAHRVALSADEEGARLKIASAFEAAGLTVPSVSEVLATTGLDSTRAQTILRMLIKDRQLIRVSDDLVFHQTAIANLKGLLASRRKESFTVSVFKEWTGVSRKYAVPLLEFLDREHVTLRRGDVREVM